LIAARTKQLLNPKALESGIPNLPDHQKQMIVLVAMGCMILGGIFLCVACFLQGQQQDNFKKSVALERSYDRLMVGNNAAGQIAPQSIKSEQDLANKMQCLHQANEILQKYLVLVPDSEKAKLELQINNADMGMGFFLLKNWGHWNINVYGDLVLGLDPQSVQEFNRLAKVQNDLRQNRKALLTEHI
jgi:hypothetical protein